MIIIPNKNGIELNEAQKESVKSAFLPLARHLVANGEKVEIEYLPSNNQSVCVILSTDVHGVKFEKMKRFVGVRGGLKC